MARILYLGTAGSDDPTRAGLPFNFAMGALDAGHQPEIFLAGEAVYLMKSVIADAVMPVAMAPLKAMLDEVVAQRVAIFV
jgi:predicted peroxiredoxin